MKYRGRGQYEARQWDGTKDPSWETWMRTEWNGWGWNGWGDDPPRLRFYRWNEMHAALPGYWIIRYGDGDFQALPPETFEQNYEPCGE